PVSRSFPTRRSSDLPLTGVGEDFVQFASGDRRKVESIVWATGFDVTRFISSFEIRGRTGVTLSEVWNGDDARAYLGLSVPGFPKDRKSTRLNSSHVK